MVICQAVLCKNIKTNFKVYCVEVIIQFFSRIISRFFKRNSGWTSGQGIGLLHFIWNTLLMRNQFAWSDSLHTGIEWRNKQDKEKEKQLEWEMTRYSLATIVQYIIKKRSQNLYNIILMWQRYNLFSIKTNIEKNISKKKPQFIIKWIAAFYIN